MRIVQPTDATRTPAATSARMEIDVSSCVTQQPMAAAQYGIPAASSSTPTDAHTRRVRSAPTTQDYS